MLPPSRFFLKYVPAGCTPLRVSVAWEGGEGKEFFIDY